MSAGALAADVITGAVTGALAGSGTGYLLARRRARRAPGRCPSCGHGLGSVDKFTLHCTEKVSTASWLDRARGVTRFAKCPCREHRPPAAGAEATS